MFNDDFHEDDEETWPHHSSTARYVTVLAIAVFVAVLISHMMQAM
jgi:hypothetical protein